jgi:Outer membrane protein beta-barrel domain
MNFKIYIISLAIILGAAAPANASNTSLVALGFGSQLGVARYQPISGVGGTQMVSELNLRFKLLKILGIDASYNLASEHQVGAGEVFASKYRISALIYPIPTNVLSVYLSGGIGASSISDLSNDSLTSKSFHAGGGLEVYLGDHFTLTGEFLILVPDVNRIAVSRQPIRLSESGDLPMGQVTTPSASDYISAENFQVNLGLKFFF